MVFSSAARALTQILSPAFRAILWKSLALTVALLALLWIALTRLLAWWASGQTLTTQYPWLESYGLVLAGFGLVVGLFFLIPPVSMLVAGFFLDDVAEKVEQADYPQDAPGRALPAGRAMVEAARFAGTALLVNLVALLFLLIPVVNIAAFFIANSYLLGREYFSLAAGRFRPQPEVQVLRRRHAGTIMLAGAAIAAMVLVPVLNLLTPLFGTVLMVHLHKRIAAKA